MGFYEETGLSDEAARQIAQMGDKTNSLDDKLIVRFYMGTIRNDSKTLLAGRPIFDDIEKVRILKPGDKDYIDKGAHQGYRERFAKQYAAFKNGEEERVSGTPLSMWPVVKASQVAELAHFHIRTVEQLASIPDGTLTNFMGGNMLKQAAREYVDRAATQAPLLAVQAELVERDAKIAAMQAQMQQMGAIISGLQAQRKMASPEATEMPDGVVPYRGQEFPVPEAAQAFVPPLPKAAMGKPDFGALGGVTREAVGSGLPLEAPKKRGRKPKSTVAAQ